MLKFFCDICGNELEQNTGIASKFITAEKESVLKGFRMPKKGQDTIVQREYIFCHWCTQKIKEYHEQLAREKKIHV
ncbi:MAG: hypothetical protein AABY22_33020 [Nanoarchaeota archaeon]